MKIELVKNRIGHLEKINEIITHLNETAAIEKPSYVLSTYFKGEVDLTSSSTLKYQTIENHDFTYNNSGFLVVPRTGLYFIKTSWVVTSQPSGTTIKLNYHLEVNGEVVDVHQNDTNSMVQSGSLSKVRFLEKGDTIVNFFSSPGSTKCYIESVADAVFIR